MLLRELQQDGLNISTYGITERAPGEYADKLIDFELGNLTKASALRYIERVKQKDHKLAGKLIVDYEEIYA